EIQEVLALRQQSAAALASCDDNLYLQLEDAVGATSAQALARFAAPGVLTLPPDAFSMDPRALQGAAAAALAGDSLTLPGLVIDGAHLPAPTPPASREVLAEAVADLDARLARLQAELDTGSAIDEARSSKDLLEKRIKEAEQQ